MFFKEKYRILFKKYKTRDLKTAGTLHVPIPLILNSQVYDLQSICMLFIKILSKQKLFHTLLVWNIVFLCLYNTRNLVLYKRCYLPPPPSYNLCTNVKYLLASLWQFCTVMVQSPSQGLKPFIMGPSILIPGLEGIKKMLCTFWHTHTHTHTHGNTLDTFTFPPEPV